MPASRRTRSTQRSESEPSRRSRSRNVLKNEEGEDKKHIKEEEKPIFLSGDSLTRRLGANVNTAIRIDQNNPDLMFPVSRQFMSSRFGGSRQSGFSQPQEEYIKDHGILCFAYLKPDWNPNLPFEPGASGLAYCSVETPEIMPLFMFKAVNEWLYHGHYEISPSEPLTVQEWKEQHETTRRTWIGNYFGHDWADTLRQCASRTDAKSVEKMEKLKEKIAEHRLQKGFQLNGQPERRATEAEISAFIKRGGPLAITPEELRMDLDSGLGRRIPVTTVVCVEYKADFQVEIAEGQKEYVKTHPVKPRTRSGRRAPTLLKDEAKEEKKIEALIEQKDKEDARKKPLKHRRLDEEDGVNVRKPKRMLLDFVLVESRLRQSVHV